MKKYIAMIPLVPTLFLVGCGDDEMVRDYTDKVDNTPNLIDDGYEYPVNENAKNYYQDDGVVYDENGYSNGNGSTMTPSNQSIYVDGVYKAEAKEYDGIYKHYVEITIKNNQIDKVMFDGRDKTGNLKSEDNDLIQKYESEFKTSPKDLMDMYSTKLRESQMINSVKSILGGETEHVAFEKLVNSALINASRGDTSTAIVDINL